MVVVNMLSTFTLPSAQRNSSTLIQTLGSDPLCLRTQDHSEVEDPPAALLCDSQAGFGRIVAFVSWVALIARWIELLSLGINVRGFRIDFQVIPRVTPKPSTGSREATCIIVFAAAEEAVTIPTFCQFPLYLL